MSKTFVLCVGSQKSGTTWLYKYLNEHPNTNMGFAKEYHVFDAIFLPACRYLIENRIREANKLFSDERFPLEAKSSVFRLLDFCIDPKGYFEYFFSLVRQDENTLLTGDITPSYSGLPVEALSMIKDGLESRGFRVKVVFIMRDPVERCISAARLYFKLRGVLPTTTEENEFLRNRFKSEAFQMRTRYDITVQNLERVFSADQIAYFTYERFFELPTISSLADFLSIPFIMPDFRYNPNPSRSANAIDQTVRREIFETYQPVYDFIRNRFGVEFMKGWREY